MGVHEAAESSYLAFQRALSDNRLSEYKWFLEREIKSWKHWTSMPLQRRLWLWRHGFPSPYAEFYDFDTYGPEAYLSELQRYRLYKSLNGRHRYLIDDKLSQYWMLSDHDDYRPTAYGLLARGRVHGSPGTVFDGEPVPAAEWLPAKLREESPLVLKKLRGKGGKQVVMCEYDGDGFVLDGEPVTEATLCRELSQLSGYLVTEFVEQHAYADGLYPHAANTIRILTLWDDRQEDLFVPMAVQRIGTERSRPIDNCSAGGLTAEIDLETGELGRAAQYPLWKDGIPWYEEHPDTGAQMEGTRIPDWDAVRSTITGIARENTNIPAIGWDVLLDESGEPVVIEANTGTAIRTMQIHRPLLEDPRVAAIAARHLPEVDAPGAVR